jgi:hypothetical protein
MIRSSPLATRKIAGRADVSVLGSRRHELGTRNAPGSAERAASVFAASDWGRLSISNLVQLLVCPDRGTFAPSPGTDLINTSFQPLQYDSA